MIESESANQPSLLVLTDSNDPSGAWLQDGLRSRGFDAVALLSTQQLVGSTTWVHSLGKEPPAFTATLEDGRVFRHDSLRAVINRIQFIPPEATTPVAAEDHAYVHQEQHAFFLSWLSAIEAPVFNPPSPRGLGGAWRPRSEWISIAASVGFEHDDFRFGVEGSDSESASPAVLPTAITLGDEIVDAGLPGDVRATCLRLARAAATPMIGIELRDRGDGTFVFVNATPYPPIHLAGDAMLDAFAYVLKDEGPGSTFLCGIPSESPIALVARELDRLGERYEFFNQRAFADHAMEFAMVRGRLEGTLRLNSTEVPLAEIRAVYVRLMDDRLLPELDDQPEGSPMRQQCRWLHDALTQWFEIARARVVNRYAPMGSNGSKPYQAQLITKHGFRTPETLVTNDPERVQEFVGRHGRVIYKSISGVRSIVSEFRETDTDRLHRIRLCPTQFQEYIAGDDIRVHVVGDRAFGTAVISESIDYRYAGRQGHETELRAIELPTHIAERAVALAAGLGLGLAGIDLIVDSAGDVYCFEVNPSPAFSYYELNSGQPIAHAIASYLAEA